MKTIYHVLIIVLMAHVMQSQDKDIRTPAILTAEDSLIKVAKKRHLSLKPTTVTDYKFENIGVAPYSSTVCMGNSLAFAITTTTQPGYYFWTLMPRTELIYDTGINCTVLPEDMTLGTHTLVVALLDTTMRYHIGGGSVTFTVLPAPSLTITPSSTIICSGNTATLTASGGSNYLWNLPTGPANTSASLVVSPSTTAIYTVNAMTPNCRGSATMAIQVISPPAVNITPSLAAICIGGSVALTASGATSYSWTTPAGLSSTGASIISTPTITTIYAVTGTRIDSTTSNPIQCPNTATAMAVVNVVPIPTISLIPSQTTLCKGNRLTVTARGGNAGTWYAWYSWNTLMGSRLSFFSGDSLLQLNIHHSGKHIYSVKALSPGCPIAQATSTINVYDTPDIKIIPKDTGICSGKITFTATGASVYTWSSNSKTFTTTSNTYSDTISITTSYTITAANSTCPYPAKTVATVKVNKSPSIWVSPLTSTISNGSGLVLTAGGASTYSWTGTQGLSSTSGSTVLANPSITTVYTVTGSTPVCPVSSATVAVNVNSLSTTSWSMGTGIPVSAPGNGGSRLYLNTQDYSMWYFSTTDNTWQTMSPGMGRNIPGLSPPNAPGPPGASPQSKPCSLQKGSCLADAVEQELDDQQKETLEEYWKLDHYTLPPAMLVYTPKNVVIGGSPTNYDRDNMATYKLSVNGGIRAKQVRVESTNWPDYVFEPGYALMPLDSLAAFVKKNRHLPGIPCEEEVTEEGQDLGKMQELMMQKIEELTLYIILLNDENKTLEKIINGKLTDIR